MRELIREESKRGATVFFSSHILGQVESVCDTVGILQDGQLIAKDSVEDLREKQGDVELVVTVADPDISDDTMAAIRDLATVSSVTAEGDRVTINCDGGSKMEILNTFEDNEVAVENFETHEASLEELFTSYTEQGGDV
jgi:ABC-2 type transport system ATP-binding protein